MTLILNHRSIDWNDLEKFVYSSWYMQNNISGQAWYQRRMRQDSIANARKQQRLTTWYTRKKQEMCIKTRLSIHCQITHIVSSIPKVPSHYCRKDIDLHFFEPKKDQCDVCFTWTHATAEEKMETQEKYDKNIEAKNPLFITKGILRYTISQFTIVYKMKGFFICGTK